MRREGDLELLVAALNEQRLRLTDRRRHDPLPDALALGERGFGRAENDVPDFESCLLGRRIGVHGQDRHRAVLQAVLGAPRLARLPEPNAHPAR